MTNMIEPDQGEICYLELCAEMEYQIFLRIKKRLLVLLDELLKQSIKLIIGSKREDASLCRSTGKNLLLFISEPSMTYFVCYQHQL
jgi:hypothetical protein